MAQLVSEKGISKAQLAEGLSSERILFRGGATVAQLAVNELVVGSNPTRGARNSLTLKHVFGVLLILSVGRIRTDLRFTAVAAAVENPVPRILSSDGETKFEGDIPTRAAREITTQNP